MLSAFGIFGTLILTASGDVVRDASLQPHNPPSLGESEHFSPLCNTQQVLTGGQPLVVSFSAPGYGGDVQFLEPRLQIADPLSGTVIEDTYVAGVDGVGSFGYTTFVGNGSRDVYLKVDGFLRKAAVGLNFTGTDIPLTFSLISGDVNNDNKIDASDLGAVQARVGKSWESEDWEAVDINGVRTSICDVNGDNTIDAADVTLVSSRLGLLGD